MTDIKKPFTMPYIAIDPCSSKSNQLNKQNIEMMHSMIDMYWDRKGAQSLALSLVHLLEERIIGVFVHLINTSWVNLSLPSYSHCSARYRKDESSCCSNKQKIEMVQSMIDMYWDRKGAQSLALSLVHLLEERIIGVFVHLINTSWVNLSLPSYSHCSARYRKDESSCCSNFSKVPNLTALLLSRQFKQWW